MAATVESNAREILNSHGNPTVEVKALLEDGAMGRATVPSGTSTGVHRVHELRDGGDRYLGKGVEKAVCAALEEIEDAIIGLEAEDQCLVNRTMIELDDTEDKSRLGTNAILGVSMTVTKAAAESTGLGLFRYVGSPNDHVLPAPIMNILDGGAHADSGVDIQEFMIAPVGAPALRETLHVGAEVYRALEKVIKDKGLSTGLGDEGDFALSVDSTKAALDLVVEAIEATGYRLGDDMALALDVASSKLCKGGKYHFEGGECIAEEMATVHADLVEDYAIISIEGPLQEDDREGYTKLTTQIGDKVQIVGDDFFIVNPKRLAEGIEEKTANALLVKVNQIGSLFETFEAVAMAHNVGYKTMMSYRSGEIEDTTIVDLTIGLNCGQIKTGAPARSERITRYNQLLHIEEYLDDTAVYAGRSTFPRFR